MIKVLIKAIWDDEVDVWTASSKDVPGLHVEAFTAEELEKRIIQYTPELLLLNGVIRVAVHQMDDKQWCASALDMDLSGYVDTQEEAENELIGMVRAQITFAYQKGQKELIFRPSATYSTEH